MGLFKFTIDLKELMDTLIIILVCYNLSTTTIFAVINKIINKVYFQEGYDISKILEDINKLDNKINTITVIVLILYLLISMYIKIN